MKKSIKKTIVCITAAAMMAGFTMTIHAEPVTVNGVIFDAEYYASSNPDVTALLGTDADILFNHYITFGRAEGRLPYEIPNMNSASEPASEETTALTEESIRNAMYALKSTYPEGTPWTNDNHYAWKGGIYSEGYGCAGFAFMLSDAAFGNAPARISNDISAVRVGDIVSINGDTHYVIILEVRPDSVIVAEGNYNNSVHWGREFSKAKLSSIASFCITRY